MSSSPHTVGSVATDPGTDPALRPQTLPRIALVGVHGFGARHLVNLRRLEEAGRLKLVAAADPVPPGPGKLQDDVDVYGSLDELLAANVNPDVVIIATPIQTHAPLALAALAAGADVYLEKPTAASMAEFDSITAAARTHGRAVQVGFQSLGSDVLAYVADLIANGTLGQVRGISASGTWVRDRAYFKRSRWAGKRSLNGTDVVDGVATNALAHAVATALRIANTTRVADVLQVDADLYRAHDVESDDTSVIRIRPVTGPTITCALTLCAAEQTEPVVTVHGTLGQAVFAYTEDILDVTIGSEAPRRVQLGRRDLLENLLEHRASGAALLSPLEETGAFMCAVETIRTAEAPAEIPSRYVDWTGDGDAAHPVVERIEDWILRATRAQATFTELGAPWARPLPSAGTLRVDDVVVAVARDGSAVVPTSSPRPYLHPIRTLAGVTVTDQMPADHVWHLGAGVALQDVNGYNLWGGRTYTRQAGGYVWRADHGRIVATGADTTDNGRVEELSWQDTSGAELLTEHRTWTCAPAGAGAWSLQLSYTLTAAGDAPVTLGSPGSNGRPQGGYGGFFWRLPACSSVTVQTPQATGEAAVHGNAAPWLAWQADFADGPATLLFLAPPEAPDPWFVRASDYPGVGSSLAWEQPVVLQPGESLTRSITVVVADGHRSGNELAALVQAR
ncbi:MAG: oxidoreductase [Micrococcaceae bacterium]|nr:oxidoreductase [Micrococcaceae bacterium]